jgi:hypothetical protein
MDTVQSASARVCAAVWTRVYLTHSIQIKRCKTGLWQRVLLASPWPHFSQGGLSYWQLTVTVVQYLWNWDTGNLLSLWYSTSEITNTSLNDSCGTINTAQTSVCLVKPSTCDSVTYKHDTYFTLGLRRCEKHASYKQLTVHTWVGVRPFPHSVPITTLLAGHQVRRVVLSCSCTVRNSGNAHSLLQNLSFPLSYRRPLTKFR